MEVVGGTRRKKRSGPDSHGLIDKMFSWSIDDIHNEELYKGEVVPIPQSFESVEQYFCSYVVPLLEETRADLSSCMEAISSAPFAEVISVVRTKSRSEGPFVYNVKVDSWKRRFRGGSKEPYKTLSGDFLVFIDFKPRTDFDLQRHGRMHTFAMVTKNMVSDDEDTGKSYYEDEMTSTSTTFRVRASEGIEFKDMMRASLFVVFLTNTTTSTRIWSGLHMFRNLNIIQNLMCSNSLGNGNCQLCSSQGGHRWAENYDSQLLSTLNESQANSVSASISKLQCCHKPSAELIWGPPGTGKTKTVSALLFSLREMDCRTLICAPTNVATVEIASRLLMLVNNRHGTGSKNNDLLCPVGDILLFGNKERMKIGSEMEEIYLDYRVDMLLECLGQLTGWRHCFTVTIDFFENCVSQYQIFIENESVKEAECSNGNGSAKEPDRSFLNYARDKYRSTAPSLQRCLSILCTHISKSYISEYTYQNMAELIRLLDKFQNLLFQNNLDSEELLELFSHADTFESSSHILCTRSTCISMLKALRQSLDELQLPRPSIGSIAGFCFRTASLIFCTASSAFRLHSMDMRAFKLLVIDEAAQLKECESLIPLQLPGLSHVILIGDERQLPAMVKSNVSKEAGFGRSLFERLSALGHSKHLLNIQYRMHPKISCFPNSKFYLNQIVDAGNVKNRSYERTYLPGPMFGPFSFINIFGGKEKTGVGHSWKNLAEVAVIENIVGNLHNAWKCSKEMLSVGVVSPYAAQVAAIQKKFGKNYENLDNFVVKVKSIDGFQGGEEDVVIISTVRTNKRGAVGFIKDPRRTNVALTRARHCLWVLGNERTLANSKSIWQNLVQDAKSRKCYFEADEDMGMANAISEANKECGQSVLFRKARWKVLLSEDFKKSFGKIKVQAKTSVISLLLKLATGWRPKSRNSHTVRGCSSNLLKQFKVEGLYVICSTDIKKESSYMQVLKVWDILSLEGVPKLAKRLDNTFRKYTDNFINRCNEIFVVGDMEFPKTWEASSEILRFKDHSNHELDTGVTDDGCDGRSYIENSKVNESLLLMKFYLLSPGMVSHLLSDHGVKETDLPFDLTDQEMEIIRYHASTFVLGLSGTGKTTVLTMKLFQNEQKHHIGAEGIEYENDDNSLHEEQIEDVQEISGAVLRQLFVTVSPKQAYAVKQQVSHLKSFACGTKGSVETSSTDVDYIDYAEQFNDIPDSFVHIPRKCYPLVITFHKFLMMLDGTLGTSYFKRFPDGRGHCYEKTREVSYDKFSCSYWPHLNTQLTKHLDPSKVFTEIISHIKGGLQAGKTHEGKLSREDYVVLSNSRNSTLHEKRDIIYDIFLQYEKLKLETGEFDVGDLVIDILCRLRHGNYIGDEMDFVYIDEVQDLTMRQISLFKYICRNVENGFVFSGDTAQTIARGIDFRFEDIRSLFYKEFMLGKEEKRLLPSIFHLNQNFRTHDGVLRLSQSIIDLLYHFFPSSIDVLDPENSLIYGEAPVLLESGNDENAMITIFGSRENVGGSKSVIGFGAEQVILVRDDCARKEISQYVGKQALILTIVECKGLEFQDVLLYNFFGSSPLNCQWRILYSYMEEQNLLSSPRSFPKFNEAKHYVLCSELKQLYMAITRTRQRLWICENVMELSKPMFDYWKKLGLAQVKKLDSSLAQSMQVASTPEEWKLQGLKLFAKNNYEMATMCFERAGDFHREGLAKVKSVAVDTRHFVSGAQHYWHSEILSVGMKVLENLNVLYSFSVKNAVPMLAQSKLLINIFEVAKFLMKRQEVPKKKKISLQGHIKMSAEKFFTTAISPDWKRSPSKNMISLREMEVSCNMLQEVILLIINTDNRITYGQIGRVVMIILGSGKLKDELWGIIKKRFEGNSPWREFIEQLCICTVSLVPQGSIIWLLHRALENTYSANWIMEPDYISPPCFLYLVERLLIWVASSHRRFFYATKSSFVEWLICQEEHSIMNFSSVAGSTPSCSTPSLVRVHNFVCTVVEQLLYDKRTMSEWLKRSNLNSNDCYALLVLRLVVIMCLLSLDSVDFSKKLFVLLGKNHIRSQIPRQFSVALRKVKMHSNLNKIVAVLAKAFRKIDNPLVIVTLGTEASEVVSKDAIFVDLKVTQCKEDILQLLFPGRTEASIDKIDDFRSRSTNSRSQKNEPPKQDEDLKSPKDEVSSDLLKLCTHVSRILDQFAVDYGKVHKINSPTIKMEVEKNIGEAADLFLEIGTMIPELKGIASALDVSEWELENTIPAIQERLGRLESRRPKIEPLLKQHLGLQNLSEPSAEASETNIASGGQHGERGGLKRADECGTKPMGDAASSSTQGKTNNSKQEINSKGRNKRPKKKKGNGGAGRNKWRRDFQV